MWWSAFIVFSAPVYSSHCFSRKNIFVILGFHFGAYQAQSPFFYGWRMVQTFKAMCSFQLCTGLCQASSFQACSDFISLFQNLGLLQANLCWLLAVCAALNQQRQSAARILFEVDVAFCCCFGWLDKAKAGAFFPSILNFCTGFAAASFLEIAAAFIAAAGLCKILAAFCLGLGQAAEASYCGRHSALRACHQRSNTLTWLKRAAGASVQAGGSARLPLRGGAFNATHPATLSP